MNNIAMAFKIIYHLPSTSNIPFHHHTTSAERLRKLFHVIFSFYPPPLPSTYPDVNPQLRTAYSQLCRSTTAINWTGNEYYIGLVVKLKKKRTESVNLKALIKKNCKFIINFLSAFSSLFPNHVMHHSFISVNSE